MDKGVRRLLAVPPAKWDEQWEAGGEHRVRSFARIAVNARFWAVFLARLAAYFEARSVDGYTHEHAVKRQNMVADRVRKALGYAYPKADRLVF